MILFRLSVITVLCDILSSLLIYHAQWNFYNNCLVFVVVMRWYVFIKRVAKITLAYDNATKVFQPNELYQVLILLDILINILIL